MLLPDELLVWRSVVRGMTMLHVNGTSSTKGCYSALQHLAAGNVEHGYVPHSGNVIARTSTFSIREHFTIPRCKITPQVPIPVLVPHSRSLAGTWLLSSNRWRTITMEAVSVCYLLVPQDGVHH
jgi:hypothetical protein